MASITSMITKAVTKAEEKIRSFKISDYATDDAGIFATEAQECRGEIVDEGRAQDMCYDAMEMGEDSTKKIRKVLEALVTFPLSTEAWRMLGDYYIRMELHVVESKKKTCAAEALKMYDTAITCARKLNPTWEEDPTVELSYGVMENRPYFRSLLGRAIALYDLGARELAIAQAKKVMFLNPSDNQGVRLLLCTWFLEVGNTEGCANLLRKYGTKRDAHLAYTDVLLQFLRWKKDGAAEDEVKNALRTALKVNPHVPGMIGIKVQENDCEDYYSPGTTQEAKIYFRESQNLWRMYPESIDWVKAQKRSFKRRKVRPSEEVDHP
jgi:tetratricopeptide (TPR) repeat protein